VTYARRPISLKKISSTIIEKATDVKRAQKMTTSVPVGESDKDEQAGAVASACAMIPTGPNDATISLRTMKKINVRYKDGAKPKLFCLYYNNHTCGSNGLN
jgi:hypothetical protein